MIMSDLGAMRGFNKSNRNGILVSADCSQEAVDAVRFLCENPRHGTSTAERGRRAFLEEYNWEKVESRLLDLYYRLS